MLNQSYRTRQEKPRGKKWELGVEPAVLATKDYEKHLAQGWIGGVAGVAYNGTDALHFAPNAAEALLLLLSLPQAFSVCRSKMQGIGSVTCCPRHPSHTGVDKCDKGAARAPEAWGQVAIATSATPLVTPH